MFNIIGQIVVGIILLGLCILVIEIVRDVYRAFKVTNIRMRVYFGKGWRRGIKRTGFFKYARIVLDDVLSSYTYTQHGGLKIYRSGKIGRTRFWGA